MINLDLELGVPGSDHGERRLIAAASPLREDEAGNLPRVCVAIFRIRICRRLSDSLFYGLLSACPIAQRYFGADVYKSPVSYCRLNRLLVANCS